MSEELSTLILMIATMLVTGVGVAGWLRQGTGRQADPVANALVSKLIERQRVLNEAERAAQIGTWEIDHRSGVVVWSEVYFGILGLTPVVFRPSPDNVFDCVHAEDRDWLTALFADSVCDKKAFEAEFRVVRQSDGKEGWLQGRATHEFDADGKLLRTIGTCMDITPHREIIHSLIRSRVQAEAARQQAQREEARFRDFAMSSADWFWETDDQGRFIYYSGTNSGLLPRDIVGRTAEECFGAEGVQANLASFAEYTRLLAERQSFRDLEFSVRVKSGEIRTVRVSGVPAHDAEGRFLGFRGVTRDLTEQKRAETALAEQVDMLNAMTAASSDAIVIIDHNGLVSFWNPAAEKIFGHARDEAIGQDAHLLIAGKTEHRAFRRAKPEFQRDGSGPAVGRTLELTAHRKDGRSLPVEMTVSSFRSLERWHAVGVIRDITERKDIERQFWQNQKMESIGTLAGGIAHDINNMLLPVLCITAAVAEDLPSDDLRREELGMVLEAAERIKSLVERILAFSRAEDARRDVFDFGAAIRDTLPLLRAALPASLEIRCTVPEDALLIAADCTQVQAMLMNLAGNAADAMEGRAGYLDMRLTGITASEDIVRAVPGLALHQPYALLRVEDNGSGIDAAILERIFDPFFTTKDVGKGTGLGLSIVHRMVVKHGGAILARSQLGHGTDFEIYLPITGVSVALE